MPIMPAQPVVPVPATGHHAQAHPQAHPQAPLKAPETFAALASGVGVKPVGSNTRPQSTQRTSKTNISTDDETSKPRANSKRHSGDHVLDVEA
jgi:hypothetical protein